MSYILDALKKADAQRERDPARGIHAQAAPVPTARHSGGASSWIWAGGAGALVAAAGAIWYLAPPRAAQPAAGDAPSATVAMVRSTPAPAFPAVAPPPVVAQARPAPLPAATAVLPPPQPQAVPERERGTAVRRPERVAVHAAPALADASATAATSSTPTRAGASSAAAVASGPAARVPVAAARASAEPAPIATGLPPDAPKLAISGGVYSPSRAQRMLIVNGQVVTEGADLGSGVVLEEIKPKSAVLRFRGNRYAVAF